MLIKYFSKSLFFLLLANYLKILLSILSFLTLFMMVIQGGKMLGVIQAFMQEGQSPFSILGNFVLTTLPLTFPLAALFSSMFYFHKLQEEGHYVALRAIGLSEKFLIFPVLLSISAFSLWFYQVNQQRIPGIRGQLRLMGNEVKAKSFLNELRPGVFNNSLNNITFFAEQIDPTTYDMKEVFMKFKLSGDSTKAIMSEEGHFDLNSESSASVGKLILGKGQMIVWDANKDVLEKFIFDKYEYPLPIFGEQFNVSTKASFLNADELKELLKKREHYIKTGEVDAEAAVRISLEFYERYTLPLSIVFFALVGSVLGGVFTPRSQKNRKVQLALISVILYYVIYFGLVGLSKKGHIAPWMATTIPLLFLLLVSIRQYPKLKWSN
jgi:lipopolysaccharide export LptBFGC system permease protein LptF